MSDESFELKSIHKESVAHALEKAQTYRLLNDPIQAESICLDILAIEPDNQEALIDLILAMTDQFSSVGAVPSKNDILQYANKLDTEYQRVYYTGLVCEREALGFLSRGQAAVFAYDGLRDAMEWYEKAEKLRPEGNDDALLRWNSCVRTIRRERLTPPPQHERELPLD
ncbi:MAG: hypothetical protein MJE77_12760 [Proteobacteria bacterium]|nr:hypothetical protein [Pseudomonadota bacterium]